MSTNLLSDVLQTLNEALLFEASAEKAKCLYRTYDEPILPKVKKPSKPNAPKTTTIPPEVPVIPQHLESIFETLQVEYKVPLIQARKYIFTAHILSLMLQVSNKLHSAIFTCTNPITCAIAENIAIAVSIHQAELYSALGSALARDWGGYTGNPLFPPFEEFVQPGKLHLVISQSIPCILTSQINQKRITEFIKSIKETFNNAEESLKQSGEKCKKLFSIDNLSSKTVFNKPEMTRSEAVDIIARSELARHALLTAPFWVKPNIGKLSTSAMAVATVANNWKSKIERRRYLSTRKAAYEFFHMLHPNVLPQPLLYSSMGEVLPTSTITKQFKNTQSSENILLHTDNRFIIKGISTPTDLEVLIPPKQTYNLDTVVFRWNPSVIAKGLKQNIRDIQKLILETKYFYTNLSIYTDELYKSEKLELGFEMKQVRRAWAFEWKKLVGKFPLSVEYLEDRPTDIEQEEIILKKALDDKAKMKDNKSNSKPTASNSKNKPASTTEMIKAPLLAYPAWGPNTPAPSITLPNPDQLVNPKLFELIDETAISIVNIITETLVYEKLYQDRIRSRNSGELFKTEIEPYHRDMHDFGEKENNTKNKVTDEIKEIDNINDENQIEKPNTDILTNNSNNSNIQSKTVDTVPHSILPLNSKSQDQFINSRALGVLGLNSCNETTIKTGSPKLVTISEGNSLRTILKISPNNLDELKQTQSQLMLKRLADNNITHIPWYLKSFNSKKALGNGLSNNTLDSLAVLPARYSKQFPCPARIVCERIRNEIDIEMGKELEDLAIKIDNYKKIEKKVKPLKSQTKTKTKSIPLSDLYVNEEIPAREQLILLGIIKLPAPAMFNQLYTTTKFSGLFFEDRIAPHVPVTEWSDGKANVAISSKTSKQDPKTTSKTGKTTKAPTTGIIDLLGKSNRFSCDPAPTRSEIRNLLQMSVVHPLQSLDILRSSKLACKSLLLVGPPGAGKSFISRAIVTETGSSFFDLSPDIIQNIIDENTIDAKIKELCEKLEINNYESNLDLNSDINLQNEMAIPTFASSSIKRNTKFIDNDMSLTFAGEEEAKITISAVTIIGKVFAVARKYAPSIIYIDDIAKYFPAKLAKGQPPLVSPMIQKFYNDMGKEILNMLKEITIGPESQNHDKIVLIGNHNTNSPDMDPGAISNNFQKTIWLPCTSFEERYDAWKDSFIQCGVYSGEHIPVQLLTLLSTTSEGLTIGGINEIVYHVCKPPRVRLVLSGKNPFSADEFLHLIKYAYCTTIEDWVSLRNHINVPSRVVI